MNEIITADAPISMKYTDLYIDNDLQKRGRAHTVVTVDDSNNVSLLKSDITISNAAIYGYAELFESTNPKIDPSIIETLLSIIKPTEDELHTIVATHEGVHSTDTDDIVVRNDAKRETRANAGALCAIIEILVNRIVNEMSNKNN